ncbi:hypothetical protein HMPREF9598_02262 [Cutibacterium acnes HL050PA1]|nr:hypothetical protein HMPREF9598_02262 [Cutibacterium acnes HL050PA1]
MDDSCPTAQLEMYVFLTPSEVSAHAVAHPITPRQVAARVTPATVRFFTLLVLVA